jgi:hypothetical protein
VDTASELPIMLNDVKAIYETLSQRGGHCRKNADENQFHQFPIEIIKYWRRKWQKKLAQ